MIPALQEEPVATAVWQWFALIFATVGEILAIVFVVRVVVRGGSPASTLLWMIVILAAPWVGLLLYYMLPRRVQMKRLRRRQDRLAWIEGGLDELTQTPPAREDEPPLHALLRRLDPDALHEGNAVRVLASGEDFFADAAQAVSEAKRFVHLETYIFRPDATGHRVLEVLSEAARRGVEVRLLYDSFGSFSLKNRDLRGLREAGGKASAYLPLLWRRRPFTLNLRNHRKLLVVDGERAWLGGRNVGDEYATDRLGKSIPWLDAMLRVEGPAVTRLHRVFVEDWFNATEEELVDRRYFPEVEPRGPDRVGVLVGGPDREIHSLWWTVFELIATARKSLEITSPYLVPPPPLLLALQVAAARGVRVSIHTNGAETENFLLYRAQRGFYREMLSAGIRLHESAGEYNHTKMMVVDNRHLMIGSANMDMRSAQLNFELAVVVPDASVATDASALFAERCGRGREIRELTDSALARVIDGLSRVVSPLL